ncbi:MAG: prepilin-type N-terminal cleavage/methylation domain-containing protein [Candidatus Omnitrophica bacterium]|nr:prepilin-type N-terminal cleavage/methylation domain-containing protein [Candidatus Omnitrophota bacterium]
MFSNRYPLLAKRLRGFTLIELIVVIAIIAVLAAIIAPNAFKAIRKAQISKTVTDMKALKTGILAYYADTGRYPDPFYFRVNGYGHRNNGCASYSFSNPPLMANEDNVVGWDGPYVDKALRSPLVHDYVAGGYTYPGTYWIGGTSCYSQSFDFNGDGSADVTGAASIQLAGLETIDALAVDNVFDAGGGRIGTNGSMNVVQSSDYCYIYYYVGI